MSVILKPADIISRTGYTSVADMPVIKALKRLPLLSIKGPWLAGGVVRRTFTGEKLDSDFDFFFADEAQLNSFRETLEMMGAFRTSNNDTNETYIIPSERSDYSPDYEETDKNYAKDPELKIQLIKFKFYGSLWEVLDSFDYTISQFGFDGTDFWATDFALWDVARKRLVPHKISYGTSSVKRMLKYANQGYTVCSGCISNVLQQVAEKPEVIQKDVLYID